MSSLQLTAEKKKKNFGEHPNKYLALLILSEL
jgi:hypothetical protein